jgi:hypothetical protein
MGREHSKGLDLDGRIILKWIFKGRDGELRTGLLMGQVADASECGNEP